MDFADPDLDRLRTLEGEFPSSEEPFPLSDEQEEAIEAILTWLETWRGGWAPKQIFRLSGYAGTGKTTVAARLSARLAERFPKWSAPTYAAFTGKAASVLQGKGCAGAQTLHSLLYIPQEEVVLNKDGTPKKTEKGRYVTKITYSPRDPDEGDFPLSWTSLFIVDEMSMVAEDIVQDLLAIERPVLVLGDPEQLEPIKGSSNSLTDGDPDVLLTTVKRTAAESPVLALATKIREADPSSRLLGLAGEQQERIYPRQLVGYDQILCWRNTTRWEIIRDIREELGRPFGMPVDGDTVMMLANRPQIGRFNGQQATVLSVEDLGDGVLGLELDDRPGSITEVWAQGFVDQKGQQDAEFDGRIDREGPMPATFAQCVTVHKAQGSEWPKVCVLNETRIMRWIADKEGRPKAEAGLSARRWLYTAVTRASEAVTVVKQDGWR